MTSFFKKGLLLSNWLIPSGLFFRFKVVSVVLGYFLLAIVVFKIVSDTFKRENRNRTSILVFGCYFGMCLVPSIQDRHLILLSPYLIWIFIKYVIQPMMNKFKNKKKLISYLVVAIYILNLAPTIIFLGIGNRKNHGGVYQKMRGLITI